MASHQADSQLVILRRQPVQGEVQVDTDYSILPEEERVLPVCVLWDIELEEERNENENQIL